MELYENLLFARRYRLETRLGAGGFGEVWRALDNMTGHPVAIKIHLKGDSARAAQDIVKEYTRVMTIHHDNLLTPSHVDVAESNAPYLVMELCKGDLSDVDLEEHDVWKLIFDVASGLYRLAENRRERHRPDGTSIEVPDPIIHQDIKPANILLRSNGMYAISDFGISKRRLSTLSTNVQDGTEGNDMDSAMTVDYAAPERFPRGKGVAVLASDIWSVGAMLYELVEGHRPFAECGGDCLNPTIGLPIPPITREGYSDELKSVIYACMAKNPADRPTAAQLKDYAGKVLKEEPRVKTWRDQKPISPKPPKNKPTPNPIRKWIYVIVAAVSILLAAVLIWKYGHDGEISTDTADTVVVEKFDTQYGKWTGREVGGEPIGKGTLVYPDNDKDGRLSYEGRMNQGLREDSDALLVYRNGNTYKGSFVNDQFGKGTLTMKDDGLYFIGEFKDNEAYLGTWYWNDGSVYSKVVNGVEK